jgi:hypothetical protein
MVRQSYRIDELISDARELGDYPEKGQPFEGIQEVVKDVPGSQRGITSKRTVRKKGKPRTDKERGRLSKGWRYPYSLSKVTRG